MKLHAAIILIYALIVFIGGIMGYVKAQSLISLLMGTGFALALFVSGGAIWKNLSWGFYSSMLLAIVLFIVFGYRYSSTMAIFPAGFMALLSAVVVLLLNFLPKK